MLDHATIRTDDLEGTRTFLETVLDLKPGYRPAFSFPGYWLYADDEPIVHLIPGHGGPVNRAGETIDHVAFRVVDHDGMRRKLDELSIPYSRMELPELGERRLFVRTPNGILLELVFRERKSEFVRLVGHEDVSDADRLGNDLDAASSVKEV
jgi:catechol 2,3-dioxygenase-like lactoylglutathione lyase family enzyme